MAAIRYCPTPGPVLLLPAVELDERVEENLKQGESQQECEK